MCVGYHMHHICCHTWIWVRSRRCSCLVTWFCYQLIAKPGNKTAAHSWPDPYEQLHMYGYFYCALFHCGYIISSCGFIYFALLYPPASTKLKGGILVSPVTLSVCPSVDRIVSALYLQQYSSDPFHICTSYQATSEGVSRVMFVSKFKNLKFWRIR